MWKSREEERTTRLTVPKRAPKRKRRPAEPSLFNPHPHRIRADEVFNAGFADSGGVTQSNFQQNLQALP